LRRFPVQARRSPRGAPSWQVTMTSIAGAPKSRCGGAVSPENPFGFPWPFPVASHPTELSPSHQLYRVNRSVQSSAVRMTSSGKPEQDLFTELEPTFGTGPPRPVPSRRSFRLDVPRVSPREREGIGRLSVGQSTSGPWSNVKSVASTQRCRRMSARCSHGLVQLRVFHAPQ
jgi:hypothetical protein